jgi:hypothetical protein
VAAILPNVKQVVDNLRVMLVLRSKTPDLVRQECDGLLLAQYWG